ncbi:YceI family protein [Cytophaga aurantiaca]|uniref:YceI family protein n=1 Tax=Cytophaga aurantiaca TaxID=29530 RepID=UPI00037DB3B6|nr:YceI family protein [Cytophaga aurantiaca]
MRTSAKIIGFAAIALLALASMSFLLKPDYTKSSVAFKIKNAGIGVDGSFKSFEAHIDYNESAQAPSSIKATINVESIDTGIEGRDKHLRKEDFFNVATYPKITFESTQILKTSGGGLIAEGKLTIKGVTKDIKIPFTHTNGIFEGTVTLNRLDYGVGGNSVTMSNEVDVSIKITASK